jgi:hypothetical protein
MPAITSATLTAYYLFDVADQIDVAWLQNAIGGGAAVARLVPKSSVPPYLQYSTPPVVVDGEALGVAEIDGFKHRMKFFDYGVVSLALTRPFSGEWAELIALSQKYIENDALEQRAEDVCREICGRFSRAFTAARATYLSEDYLVFALTGLEGHIPAEQLVLSHGPEIALLLRGERHALSQQEQAEILKNRLSYLADDLVIPTWNAALVYDTEQGAQAVLEIFEFANSQLLEFRYYDQLLDLQLGKIYPRLQHQRWFDMLVGGRYTRAANDLHALFIDVNEITDKTQNALKLVGDIYAARVFNLVAARLGLDRWKESVEDKLETLDDIYRFAVEQVSIARGHFLELTIILILIFELVLFFLGIMK